MTIAEAARRLGMSPAWFKGVAEKEVLRITRRGSRPGVAWQDVLDHIERSKITRVGSTVLREVAEDVRGVRVMDEVRNRLEWSDGDLAEALGVSWGWLSRWRVEGVRRRHFPTLVALLTADPAVMPPSRRQRWAEQRSELVTKVVTDGP